MIPKINLYSRNTPKFFKLEDILFKKNITFVSVDLPNSIDLTTNKLITTILSDISQFENTIVDKKTDKNKGNIKVEKLSLIKL